MRKLHIMCAESEQNMQITKQNASKALKKYIKFAQNLAFC